MKPGRWPSLYQKPVRSAHRFDYCIKHGIFFFYVIFIQSHIISNTCNHN